MPNVSNYDEQGGARTVIGGSLDIISGGDLDIESGGALKIAGTQVNAGALELDQRALTMSVTLGSSSTRYLVVPWAGELTTLYSVVNAALTTAAETITLSNNAGTAMTGGVITMATAAAAGEIDSATPTTQNTFTAGQKLKVAIGGENATAATADLTFLYTIT